MRVDAVRIIAADPVIGVSPRRLTAGAEIAGGRAAQPAGSARFASVAASDTGAIDAHAAATLTAHSTGSPIGRALRAAGVRRRGGVIRPPCGARVAAGVERGRSIAGAGLIQELRPRSATAGCGNAEQERGALNETPYCRAHTRLPRRAH